MKSRKTRNYLGKHDDMESDKIKKRESIYGCMKGRIVIADDFNDTPDCFNNYDSIDNAYGMLSEYADPNKIPLEEGAFERAMVKKHESTGV